MKIEFKWCKIYDIPNKHNCSHYEGTYRAKVIGGWLIKHETWTDYQYETQDDNEYNKRYINEEGYQNINNVIIFISDPNHEWEVYFEIDDNSLT